MNRQINLDPAITIKTQLSWATQTITSEYVIDRINPDGGLNGSLKVEYKDIPRSVCDSIAKILHDSAQPLVEALTREKIEQAEILGTN